MSKTKTPAPAGLVRPQGKSLGSRILEHWQLYVLLLIPVILTVIYKYIPMYGMVQSFNVSVASALMLSEASRQRALAGMYDQRLWSDEEYEERLNKWLEKA